MKLLKKRNVINTCSKKINILFKKYNFEKERKKYIVDNIEAKIIFELISKNETDELGIAISSGGCVDVYDEAGWTPLIFATFNHNADAVRLLLKAGCDIEAEDNAGMQAIDYAVLGNDVEIISLLKVGDNNDSPTPS